MITLPGRKREFCDGLPRRDFLQIGGLALGGISLPQLLRAEGIAGRKTQKSVIMIFLSGGPPHQDMFDLKPEAPIEIRGEFSPVPTNVAGIEICEHLPRLAKMMDRFSIIRSVVGAEERHAAFQCQTGRSFARQPQGGWPSLGSCVSKLLGPSDQASPAFVGLAPPMKTSTWADPGQPGFLGPSHAPFRPNADGKSDMVLNAITPERLDDRKTLLREFDRFRREADFNRSIEGMDVWQQQAFGILTSSRLAGALDLEKEDPQLRDRYGRGSSEPAGYGDAGPLLNDYFLTARRLVESGVRVVTLAYGRWDWHGRPHGTTFENAKTHLPMLDTGVTALVEDLENRGMLDDVTVLVWGEFGRTPKINANGGRDHWPRVSCALMAGGGIRGGQVIGSTTRYAEEAKDRPVTFGEIFATVYHNLGIDVASATVNDLAGRPTYLVDHAQPVRELL